MTDFQMLVLAPILVVDMTVVLCVLYAWIRRYFFEKGTKKNDYVLVAFLGGFAMILFNYLWFVPTVINGDVARKMSDVESENCSHAYTEDGQSFTSDQCEFFQKVLHGNFGGSEEQFDIVELTQ